MAERTGGLKVKKPLGGPVANIVDEAQRILGEAAAHSLTVRLIGGLAVRMHATEQPKGGLAREYKDIDLVTPGNKSREVNDLIESLGYTPDHAFNALNSRRRALFYDLAHGRQLDVFVGGFEMCHKIPVADRLDLDQITVPLAELLLTKLQIIELNEKDLRDILALVIEHEIADHDSNAINAAHIAKLCADDWGLWRTSKQTIERARLSVGRFDLADAHRAVLDTRLEDLWSRIEAEPKSRRWKLRARVGDRVRWYLEPEEVA